MRKIKKINGFLVVKFNDREKREYEGTALGEYGVIDAEVYPRCGEIVCGVWPHIVSEGHLVASTVVAQGGASGGGNPFPRVGTFAASEEFYHFGAYTIYQGFASDIEVGSKAAQGAKVYLRCSTSTRCSTNAKGGAAE